jgi:FkbM family methyltransferase
MATNSTKTKRRFDLVELTVICAVVVVATWLVTHDQYRRRQNRLSFFASGAEAELAPLERRYEGRRFSRNMEEWLIRDHFQDARDGVVLDVGANHFRNESNTYFLETSLGWSGIAVEALEEFAADYRTHRPRTRFVAMFASDVPDSSVQFFVPADNKLVASASHEFTVREGAPGVARTVPTTTLNSVLEQAGISRLDFISMDIELSEPKALAGFDIDRYQPKLVCIEAHLDVRQQILDYFAMHGYTVIGKYLRADPKNLYFQPLAKTAS